jgi:hypothetical protein
MMQKFETQFSQTISVARCYQDTTTPAVPGFIPAGAMLPLPRYRSPINIFPNVLSNCQIFLITLVLPRHNATCEISPETGLPVEFDCLFQVISRLDPFALG